MSKQRLVPYRSVRTCINYILSSIEKLEFTYRLGESNFYNGHKLDKEATIFNLIIISEFLKTFRDHHKSIWEQYKFIGWESFIKLRNDIIHQVENLKYEIIWNTLADMPVLKSQILSIMNNNNLTYEPVDEYPDYDENLDYLGESTLKYLNYLINLRTNDNMLIED